MGLVPLFFALGVIRLLLIFVLLLLLLLFERLFHQLAIVQRVVITGGQRQRPVIGLQCLFVLALPGQGVTPVVLRRGRVQRCQRLAGLIIATGLVFGGRFPGRVLETIRRARRIPGVERPPRLLIAGQPQIPPFHGIGAARNRRQHHQQQHTEPAASKRQRRQQHQRRQQPDTRIPPLIDMQGRAFGLLGLRAPVGEFQDGLGIGGARVQRAIDAAAGLSHIPQGLDIEPGDYQSTILVLEKAAIGQRDRGAIPGADANQRNAIAVSTYLPGGIDGRCHLLAGRQHQHVTGFLSRLTQQARGHLQPQVQARALHRHDARREGGELGSDGAGIIGERRDHERVTRISHQSDLTVLARLHQIVDLESRPLQPVRLEIGGLHGPGEIEHDHHSGEIAECWGRQALPSRPCQRDNRQQTDGARQPGRET